MTKGISERTTADAKSDQGNAEHFPSGGHASGKACFNDVSTVLEEGSAKESKQKKKQQTPNKPVESRKSQG